MGFHLYCVTGPACLPGDVRGIDDRPVSAISAGDLAVWASPADAPLRASLDAVRAHNAVVEAAQECETPVPLRFGQWLANEPAVRARLAERAADWQARLAELAGTIEYGVRVLDPARGAGGRAPAAPARDVHPPASGMGRAYLESLAGRASARAQRTAAAEELAAALERALGPLVVRSRADALETEHGLATIAHLVRRRDADAYRAAVERAFAAWPELTFLTSGPWPPYSFAA